MNTPIIDFVKKYADSGVIRAHVPGHKGKDYIGNEQFDITEIDGADVLYRGNGIIRQSESNATELFGTARTVYSCEGSSLSIRTMVYLATLYAKQNGRTQKILACRNAHRSFMTACALLDVSVDWLYSDRDNGIIACEITPESLEKRLEESDEKPIAFYVTSPDYLGNIADIEGLSAVCKNNGVLLLVDNAHGAYLNFLENNNHPMKLGADMCCDSAHKTLPVLTGGAYLHISKHAPEILSYNAERAMMLFASTSPSYLILQSLDNANLYIANGYRERLNGFCEKMGSFKKRLCDIGFNLVGNEPLKLSIAPKSYGYTGEILADILRENNVECEYSDRDYTVMMLTPEITEGELEHIEKALCNIEKKEAIDEKIPALPKPKRAKEIRDAMMSPSRECDVGDCLGKTIADAVISCPPAIPVIVAGEVVDEETVKCLKYYGITRCNVIE